MTRPDGRLAHIEQEILHPHFEHILDEAEAKVEREQQSGSYEPVKVEGSVQVKVSTDAVYRTFVISTGTNPVRQLLPRDPGRLRATVMSIDEDIVLCESQQLAQELANSEASVPRPAGAYLPKTTPAVLYNTGQLWAAATSSTSTRVSVIIERA